jgi:CRISPR/Cas system CSM-associated protein Csm5 (group 7 of RAMP superfamily)
LLVQAGSELLEATRHVKTAHSSASVADGRSDTHTFAPSHMNVFYSEAVRIVDGCTVPRHPMQRRLRQATGSNRIRSWTTYSVESRPRVNHAETSRVKYNAW